MINLFPTVLYSCMLGMVLTALLQVFKRPAQKQNFYLQGLFVLLLVHLLGELFIYSGAYVYAPGLAGLQLPFRILLGPALYLYAHATMSAEKAVDKKILWLAAAGPILVVVAMLPFMFLISPAEKLALASPAIRDPELWRIALFTCLFSTVTFIVFTAVFLILSLKLHSAHVQQLMERFSEIEHNSLAWFRSILWVWGAVWLLFSVEFMAGAMGWLWVGSGKLLPTLEVIALGIFIQKSLAQKILEQSEKGAPRTSQPREAIISSEKMQLIASKLHRAMVEDKLFLQDDLSLNRLSQAIAETENHISETLSQHLNTRFFQFVNRYRVEEAKRELAQSDKLITTIAFVVGFNSKSTFNTAFKNMTGHSPSAYRNLSNQQC